METFNELISRLTPLSVATACGISWRAVYKWLERGGLPGTEYTGKTKHSEAISVLTNGQYTPDQILQIGMYRADTPEPAQS